MSGKKFFILLFLISAGVSLQAEIIKMSHVTNKKGIVFSMKRDIFSANVLISNETQNVKRNDYLKTQEKKEEKPDLEEEVRKGIFFEGYILKSGKIHGLINVNGEFFVVRKDDVLLNKIKVIKIDEKEISVEVESTIFKIKLKGDEND